VRYAEHELAHEIVGLLLDLGAGCGGPLLVAPVNLNKPETHVNNSYFRSPFVTLLTFTGDFMERKKVVAKLSAWGL
jgi:hypothetical protein